MAHGHSARERCASIEAGVSNRGRSRPRFDLNGLIFYQSDAIDHDKEQYNQQCDDPLSHNLGSFLHPGTMMI
jgi:hypothetical protein